MVALSISYSDHSGYRNTNDYDYSLAHSSRQKNVPTNCNYDDGGSDSLVFYVKHLALMIISEWDINIAI